MGSKRQNVNAQMKREDYESIDDTRAKAEDVGTFRVASQEQLSKRKIIRRSGGSGSWGTSVTAASEAVPSAVSSNNGFSSKPVVFSFGSSTAPSSASGGNNSNPFGGIKLAAPDQTSAKSLGFSFGLPPNREADTSSNPSTGINNAALAKSGPSDKVMSEYKRIHYAQIRFPYTSELFESPRDVMDFAGGYALEKLKQLGKSSAPATTSFASGTSASTHKTDSEPKSPFQLSEATKTPFQGFTFGGGSNSLLAQPNSNLSSGKTPAVTFTAPIQPADSANNQETDDGDGTIKEAPELALKAENKEETILYEGRAALHKLLDDKKWKGYGAMSMQLLQNKKDSTFHRIVCRNDVGKVQFNMRVVKNMQFTRTSTKDVKTGKVTRGAISFMGMAEGDAAGKPGMYMLKVRIEQLDELHKHLESMAENS